MSCFAASRTKTSETLANHGGLRYKNRPGREHGGLPQKRCDEVTGRILLGSRFSCFALLGIGNSCGPFQ